MKSFLMLGQSNMAGRGFIDEVPRICNEKIKMLRNGRWQLMSEPINYDREVAGVGLASSFALSWVEDHPTEEIGLIPCAEGGSSLDEWTIEGPLYQHALYQAKLALAEGDLAGILWHQGESDSYQGLWETYYQKFLTIITALRKDLGVPDIPVIIGGLGDYLGKVGFGKHCVEFEKVSKELQCFAEEQANCYFVSAVDLTANPDGIHLDALSQRKFGLRYYEAFKRGEHILSPLESEKDSLILDEDRPKTINERLYLASYELAMGQMTYLEFEQTLAHLQNHQGGATE